MISIAQTINTVRKYELMNLTMEELKRQTISLLQPVAFFLETPYEPIALDNYGDLVLLAYFIESSHTAIQSIHTLISYDIMQMLMHDINITSLLQHAYERYTTSPLF